MDVLQNGLIDPLSRLLWNYVLVYLLVGAGCSGKELSGSELPSLLSVIPDKAAAKGQG